MAKDPATKKYKHQGNFKKLGYGRKVKRGSGHAPMRDVAFLKPPKFQSHLTLGELARLVNKSETWIIKLEKEGRIPKAIRHRHGLVPVRLWSPEQVDEIRIVFSRMKVGKPPGGGKRR